MRHAIIMAALLVLGCETVEHHYHYGSDAGADVAAADAGADSLPVGRCVTHDDCDLGMACEQRAASGDGFGVCWPNTCSMGVCGALLPLVECETHDDCEALIGR